MNDLQNKSVCRQTSDKGLLSKVHKELTQQQENNLTEEE